MGAPHGSSCESVNDCSTLSLCRRSTLTLERFFGCVLQTLDVDSIQLHYILCVLQCWIRRNCSLKPFWLAQSGGSAADFFSHLAGIFLEIEAMPIAHPHGFSANIKASLRAVPI